MNILSLSNFIPEQICDTVRFFGYPGDIRISHYCQYAADFVSRALADSEVDGAVFPKSCDSCRVIGSYLKECGKFIHQVHVPTGRDDTAVSYFADSLRKYRRAVEDYYGVTLADISERARTVSARNRVLRELYEGLPKTDYSAYLDMLHELLTRPLMEQTVQETLPKCQNGDGAPVFLVGSTMTDTGIAKRIEDAGMKIVGDRLPESRRLIFAPEVRTEGDIFENIAASVLRTAPSPTQNDFQRILSEDRDELIQKGVRGVIFVTQKYCEPYDYLYPAYKTMLDETGIRSLRLTVDGSGTHGTALAIETFGDML